MALPKKKKRDGQSPEMRFFTQQRAKSLNSYLSSVQSAQSRPRNAGGLVEFNDKKSIEPNAREYQTNVVQPIRDALNKNNPQIINANTYEAIHAGVQNNFISQADGKALVQQVNNLRSKLRDKPVVFIENDGRRTGMRWSPTGDDSQKKLLTHGDLVTNNTYQKPETKDDTIAFLNSRVDNRNALSKKASAPPQTEENAWFTAAKTGASVPLSVARVGLDPLGVGSQSIRTTADLLGKTNLGKALHTSDIAHTLLPDQQDINKYREAQEKGEANYNPMIESAANQNAFSSGAQSLPLGLYTGTSNLIYGPDIQGALRNEGLSATDKLMTDAENAAKAPGSTFSYYLGQAVPSLVAGLPLIGAQLNTARTLGMAILAPIGKAELGGAIGTGVGIVGPAALGAATPFMPEHAANVTRTLLDPIGSAWKAGIPQEAQGVLAESDPNGDLQNLAHLTAGVAVMGGPSMQMWRDVKSTASRGMEFYKHQLGKGITPSDAFKKSLSVYGKSRIATQLGTEMAFGGGTPLLHSIGQAVASINRNKSDRPEEVEHFDSTRALTSTVLGLLFQTRVPHAFHKAFEYNPLQKMEIRALARNTAVNAVNKPNASVEKMREWFISKFNYEPNEEDLYRLTTAVKVVNDESLANLLNNAEHPTAPRTVAFRSHDEAIDALTSNNEAYDPTARQQIEQLAGYVRNAETNEDAADYSQNPLSKVDIDQQLGYDAVSRHMEIQRLTDELTPHYEALMKMKGAAKKVTNANHWGIKLDDERTMVVNKTSGMRRIVKGTDLKNVDYIDPLAVRPATQTAGRLQTAIDSFDATAADAHADMARTEVKERDGAERQGYVIGFTPSGNVIVNSRRDGLWFAPREKLVPVDEETTLNGLDSTHQWLKSQAKVFTDTNGVYDPSSSPDEQFPSLLNISGTKIAGRLIYSKNSLGIFQLKQGGVIFQRGARGTVLPPIEIGGSLTPAESIVSQIRQAIQNEDFPPRYVNVEISFGDVKIPVSVDFDAFDAIGWDTSPDLSTQEKKERSLFRLQTNNEHIADLIMQRVAERLARAKSLAISNPVPDVGQIITRSKFGLRPSEPYIVVHSEKENGMFMARPLNNLDGETYIGMSENFPGWEATNSMSRDALERIYANTSAIHGLTPESMYPGESSIDIPLYDMVSALSRNGKPAAIIQQLYTSTPEDLLKNLENIFDAAQLVYTHPELQTIDVYASVEHTLKEWMLLNRDHADLVPDVISTLFSKNVKNTPDSKLAIALYALSKSEKIDEAYTSIIQADTDPISTITDTSGEAMNSAPPREQRVPLIVSVARRLNNTVYKSNSSNVNLDTYVNRVIDQVFKVTDSTERQKLFDDLKKTSHLLRSLIPALTNTIVTADKAWLLNKFSGLPIEIQHQATDLPINDTSPVVPVEITGWHKSEAKYEAALNHVRQMIESADDPNAVRKMLTDNGYEYFVSLVDNPNAITDRVSVRQRLVRDVGAAKQWMAEQSDVGRKRLAAQQTRVIVESAILLANNRERDTNFVVGEKKTQAALVHFDGSLIDGIIESMPQEGGLIKIGSRTIDITMPDRAQIAEIINELQTKYSENDLAHKAANDVEGLMGGEEMYVLDVGDGVETAVAIDNSRRSNQISATMRQIVDNMPAEDRQKIAVFLGPWEAVRRYMEEMILLKPNEGRDQDALEHIVYALAKVDENEAYSLKTLFNKAGNYDTFINNARSVREKMDERQLQNDVYAVDKSTGATGRVETRLDTELNNAIGELVKVLKAGDPFSRGEEGFADLAGLSFIMMPEFLGTTPSLVRTKRANQLKAQELMRTHQAIARDLQNDSRLAAQYQKDIIEVMDTRQQITGNTVRFMGLNASEYNPNDMALISEAMETVLNGRKNRRLTDADLNAIVEEAGRLQLAYALLDRDTQSYKDDPNAAKVRGVTITIDGNGSSHFSDATTREPAKQFTAYKVYTKAGLEALLLATLRNETLIEDNVSLRDFVQHRTAANEKYRTLLETTSALRDHLNHVVFQRGNTKTMRALYLPWSGDVVENSDLHAEAISGQVFLNRFMEAAEKAIPSNKVELFRSSVRELMDKNKADDGSFTFEITQLNNLLNPFGVNIQNIMPRNWYGEGLGASFSTGDGMSVAYRITGRMAAMQAKGGVRFGLIERARNNGLGERLLNYKNNNVTDISTGLNIYSRPIDPRQLTANDVSLFIDDYTDLLTVLNKANKENALVDTNLITNVQAELTYYRELQKTFKADDQRSEMSARVTDIIKEYTDVAAVARYAAEFHDMFANKAAMRQLAFELDSTGTSINEYVALGIAGGIDPNIFKQAINQNFSVKMLLSDKGREIGLTETQQAKLKHLRIAQLKQDFYNSNHQLLIATSKTLMEEGVLHNGVNGVEVYGQLLPMRDARQLDAVQHMLFLASNNGVERTAFTIAHELGHFIFESLPDYLQVEYLHSVINERGTNAKNQINVQPHAVEAYDLVNTAYKAYQDYLKLSNNNGQPANPELFSLKDSIEGWNGWTLTTEGSKHYLKELSTTALTNFILNDGVVMSDSNRNTRSEHATGVLQHYGQVLRNLHKRIVHDAHDLLTIDGKPYNGFFVKPFSYTIQHRANTDKFVPLRHGSNLFFTVPHQRGRTGALLVNTPGDMHELGQTLGATGNADFAEYMFGKDDTAKEIIGALNSEGYTIMDSSIQSGPFYRNNRNDGLYSYGRKVTGKVVGIVRATSYESFQDAISDGYDPAFMAVNSRGKKVVWIQDAKRPTDTNKYYSTRIGSNQQEVNEEGNATNRRSGAVKKDYAYIVESTGSVKLFKKRLGEEEKGYETKSWDNVTLRHLVGHDAFGLEETARPYIVETGKVGNNTFNNVVYTMLSRVDQKLRELGGDINYGMQVESQNAIAREYSNKPDGFTDVYTSAVVADAERSHGNIAQQLVAEEGDLKAAQLARVGDWSRIKNKAMSFATWVSKNKEKLPAVLPDLIKSLARSMYSYNKNTDDISLSNWYAGLKTKVEFGGKSFDGQSLAIWLSQFAGPEFTNHLENMYNKWAEHVESGATEPFDFGSLGYTTEITMGGRLFDIGPRLQEIFANTDETQMGELFQNAYVGTMELLWHNYLNQVMPSDDSVSNQLPVFQTVLFDRGVDITNTSLPQTVTLFGHTIDVAPLIEYAKDKYSDSNKEQIINQIKLARTHAPAGEMLINSDQTPLHTANKAALNWVRNIIFNGDDNRFLEYIQDLTGQSTIKQANALNLFNAVRHVQNIDSQMRRKALRNWKSWSIVDTHGDNVILAAPDKQIGRSIYDEHKYGSLVSVNLVTGETNYVAANVEYRADGTRKTYVPIKSFGQFLQFQNRESDARHRTLSGSQPRTLQEVFGDYANVAYSQFSNDPTFMVTGRTYFTLPSRDFFASPVDVNGNINNSGMNLYRVATIDGKMLVHEIEPWWSNSDNAEQDNWQLLLRASTHHLSADDRAQISQYRLLPEEYHIAKLLLAKDKLENGHHSEKLARVITDKNIFGKQQDRLVMNETSDDTWYSLDPTRRSVVPDEKIPATWSSLEPQHGFENDYDVAEAFYLARHADQVGKTESLSDNNDITLYRDPSLSHPVATSVENGRFIIRLNSEHWDELSEPLNSLNPFGRKTNLKSTKPKTAVTITNPLTALKGNKRFSILQMLGNDFRYILSNDLSTFAVQSFKAMSGDPTLIFPAMLALPSLIMPNMRDIPFWIGPLLEKYIYEKHGIGAGFGDMYYNKLMNKMLDRWNNIAIKRDPNTQRFTWDDLRNFGYHSIYSEWLNEFESHQASNPSRYKSILDVPMNPHDENINNGMMIELAPLFVGYGNMFSPMFWFPKRWDQTRLLMRDVMHLKHALDVLHQSKDLYVPNENNEAADKLSLAQSNANRRQAMRHVNLDFGLQKFSQPETQAPFFKLINTAFNFMQTAPAYHRNFLNSMPLLGEWSYYFRKGVNEKYAKIGQYLPDAFDGDVFDLGWEKSYYEPARANHWANAQRNKRALHQIVGTIAISGLVGLLGWLDHHFNERGIPYDGMDVFNPGSKKFGITRMSNNFAVALPPLQRFARIIRPLVSLVGPSEHTPQLSMKAAFDAAIRSYAQSKFQNLYHIIESSITGGTYSGPPIAEPAAGYLTAQNSGVYTPWTGGMQRYLPSQSNWGMNGFNLVVAQQAFEDMAKLGVISAVSRANYMRDGIFGRFEETDVPVVDKKQAYKLMAQTTIPRMLGFTVYYEPLEWRLIMKDKDKKTGMTLARQIWLMQHNWYDYPSALSIVRNNGFKSLIYGYPTGEHDATSIGLPSGKTLNQSKENPNPQLPIGQVGTEELERMRNEPEPEPQEDLDEYGMPREQ